MGRKTFLGLSHLVRVVWCPLPNGRQAIPKAAEGAEIPYCPLGCGALHPAQAEGKHQEERNKGEQRTRDWTKLKRLASKPLKTATEKATEQDHTQRLKTQASPLQKKAWLGKRGREGGRKRKGRERERRH